MEGVEHTAKAEIHSETDRVRFVLDGQFGHIQGERIRLLIEVPQRVQPRRWVVEIRAVKDVYKTAELDRTNRKGTGWRRICGFLLWRR
jgi:hypothetical protein